MKTTTTMGKLKADKISHELKQKHPKNKKNKFLLVFDESKRAYVYKTGDP